MRRRVTIALALAVPSSMFLLVGAHAETTSATSGVSSGSSTTTSPTTTTKPSSRSVAPLTGLPYPKRLLKNRSALTIKIDNTPEAHPQFGVSEADVVYEEIV